MSGKQSSRKLLVLLLTALKQSSSMRALGVKMGHSAAELTRWPNDTSSRWNDGASPEQGGAGGQTVTRTSDSDTLLHMAPQALRTLFRAVPDSQ